MSDLKESSTWWKTGLRARFLFVDARAGIFVVPVGFYPRLSTLGILLVVFVVLALLERRGYTPEVAWQILKLKVVSLGRYPVTIRRQTTLWKWRDRRYQ